MESGNMKKDVLEYLSNELYSIGKEWGYSKLVIRNKSTYSSDIYIIKNHAIQLEIDWFENDLFMYAVSLRKRKLPDDSVIYKYPDGQLCRKYIEEIYGIKHPTEKNNPHRYTQKYLYDCFDFYTQLIKTKPETLFEYLNSIEETETGPAS